MNKHILAAIALCCGFASCNDENANLHNSIEQFRIQHDRLFKTENIKSIHAFTFLSDGSRGARFTIPVDGTDFSTFSIDDENVSKIVLLAGDNIHPDNLEGSYFELKSKIAPVVDYQADFPKVYFSSEVDLQSKDHVNSDIQMTKSVSKIEFVFDRQGTMTIDSCIISGVADRASLLPSNPEQISGIEYKKIRLSESQLKSNDGVQKSFVYAYDTEMTQTKASIYVTNQGQSDVIDVTFDEGLKRNNAYELSLSSVSNELQATLSVKPWDYAGTIVVGPESLDYAVDLSKSVLPSFVRVSETLDTLFVPSCNATLTLAVDANVETDYKMSGDQLEVIQKETDYLVNSYEITIPQKAIGEESSNAYLYFSEKGEDKFGEKPIVIVREPSRLLSSIENFSVKGNQVVYPEYIDGTLATIRPGHTITSYDMGSDGYQYQWVGLIRKSGKFFVEGAFKPNDVEAKGQRQVSSLTIRFTDGVEETHSFSRVRTSLPVVKFGNKYWAKYNMRGNSKNMNDQIGMNQDQANIWEYLKSCSNDQFLYYSGDEYAGSNPQGLKLVKNAAGNLVYGGYTEAFGAGTINDTKVDSHCPEGYEVPAEQEIRAMIGSRVVQLFPLEKGEEESDAYFIDNQRYTVNRYRRNALEKDGVSIEDVYHIKITNPQGESLVLSGVGFQADPNNVAWGYWLLANVTDSRKFVGFNHTQGNFYMQSHSGKKTNLVRCVKKPVSWVLQDY